MKPRFQTRLFAKALFAALSIAVPNAQAVSNTWLVDSDGDWNTATNWTGLVDIPGDTTGTTSADIATFGKSLTANRIVTVDANRNISGITLSNTSNFGYTLSGGNILLSNGGTIQTTTTNGTHTDAISSPIEIQGDGGTATFGTNTTTNTRLLSIGDVTGVSTIGNTTALTLNGTVTGINLVTGTVGDGTAGGALSITKSGAGLWRLQGANTYTGGTAINGGTLSLNSAGALGSSGTISFGGGTLQFSANNTTDYSARFSTAATQAFRFDTNGQNVTLGTALVSIGGSLTKSGAGKLTLGAASTLDGAYTMGGSGTLDLGGFTHTTSGTVALNSGTVTNGTFSSSGSYTSSGDSPVVSAILNGTAGLTRNGLNALQLTVSNGFSGGTTLTSGEVRISKVDSLGTGNISFEGGLLGLGANMAAVTNTMSATGSNNYRFDSTSFTATYSATLAGATNGLSKANAGTIILTSTANSYGGVTTVTRGTLTVSLLADGGANSGIGTSSSAGSNLIIGGTGGQGQAILRYAGSTNSSTDRLFTISNATGTSATIENNGTGTLTFSNTGNIAFTGTLLTARILGLAGSNTGDNTFAPKLEDGDAATSLIKSGSSKWILTNVHTYTGGTSITGGTLLLSGGDNRLSTTGNLSVATSDDTHGLDLGGNSQTTSGTVTMGRGVIKNGTLVSNGSFVANAKANISANLQGSAGLTMSGTEIVTLSGNNSFSGPITLGGTNASINVNSATALSTGAITFSGGALASTGTRTLSNLMSAGGTNDYRFIPGSGNTLTITADLGGATNGLVMNEAGTTSLTGNNTYGGVTKISRGTLQVASLADGGLTSSIGNSSNAASNLLIGHATQDAILKYVGTTAASTDRLFTFDKVSAATKAAIINNSSVNAAHTLSFTNPGSIEFGGVTGVRTFKLDGTNTGDNSFALKIENNGASLTSFTKSGIGKWILTGDNTYTGATTIGAGTLFIGGAQTAATGTITVRATGLLGGNGSSGGAVTMESGGGLAARITNWTGSAGTGYEDLAVVSVNAANVPMKLTINTTGITNFTESTKSFTILNTSGGITNFSPSNVTITAPGFIGSGTWSVGVESNSLVLSYTAGSGPVSFSTWASANGVSGGVNGDSDNDGIPNGVEYGLDTNPNGSDGAPGTYIGNVLSFGKRTLTSGNSDLTYRIEVSPDLGVTPWTEVSGYITNDSSEISATIPTGPVKNFGRLRVVVTP